MGLSFSGIRRKFVIIFSQSNAIAIQFVAQVKEAAPGSSLFLASFSIVKATGVVDCDTASVWGDSVCIQFAVQRWSVVDCMRC